MDKLRREPSQMREVDLSDSRTASWSESPSTQAQPLSSTNDQSIDSFLSSAIERRATQAPRNARPLSTSPTELTDVEKKEHELRRRLAAMRSVQQKGGPAPKIASPALIPPPSQARSDIHHSLQRHPSLTPSPSAIPSHLSDPQPTSAKVKAALKLVLGADLLPQQLTPLLGLLTSILEDILKVEQREEARAQEAAAAPPIEDEHERAEAGVDALPTSLLQPHHIHSIEELDSNFSSVLSAISIVREILAERLPIALAPSSTRSVSTQTLPKPVPFSPSLPSHSITLSQKNTVQSSSTSLSRIPKIDRTAPALQIPFLFPAPCLHSLPTPNVSSSPHTSASTQPSTRTLAAAPPLKHASPAGCISPINTLQKIIPSFSPPPPTKRSGRPPSPPRPPSTSGRSKGTISTVSAQAHKRSRDILPDKEQVSALTLNSTEDGRPRRGVLDSELACYMSEAKRLRIERISTVSHSPPTSLPKLDEASTSSSDERARSARPPSPGDHWPVASLPRLQRPPSSPPPPLRRRTPPPPERSSIQPTRPLHLPPRPSFTPLIEDSLGQIGGEREREWEMEEQAT